MFDELFRKKRDRLRNPQSRAPAAYLPVIPVRLTEHREGSAKPTACSGHDRPVTIECQPGEYSRCAIRSTSCTTNIGAEIQRHA